MKTFDDELEMYDEEIKMDDDEINAMLIDMAKEQGEE